MPCEPTHDIPADLATLTRLFRTKVTVCSCSCWLFDRVDRYGYSSFKYNGSNVIGHRFAYERLLGEIPAGLDLDHSCDRHRNCVNPAHLTPVTKTENSVRANARRWGTST